MIQIEEAVDAAKKFAGRLYADDELRQIRVEEIETTEDEKYWLVTLGWVEPATKTISGMFGAQESRIETLPRVYKTFRIKADDGSVESMKMRDA